jgi:hypothetical protein
MAIRQRIYSLLEQNESINKFQSLATEASKEFSRARELNPEDEHNYISEAQMLIRMLDSIKAGSQNKLYDYMKSKDAETFLKEAFQHAEDLLEHVRRNKEGEGASSFEQDCRARLDSLYGRFEDAIRTWNTMLGRPGIYSPPLRRQVVWTYLARARRSWDKLSVDEVKAIVQLMEENLREESSDPRNLRLWLQAVRRLPFPPSIEEAIEKVAYWKANTDSLEATYYLYVLNSLLALNGLALARNLALEALDECRTKARLRRNRTKSYEWLGKGRGLSQLIHHSRLGEWRKEDDFWEFSAPLLVAEGRISNYYGPEAGEVELVGGLKAFFVPGKGHFFAKDLNSSVNFYLGFSYDGYRAWNVRPAGATAPSS